MDIPFETSNHFSLNADLLHGFSEWPPAFHPHAELLYVLEGEIPVTVEGVTHNVAPGEAALLFPYLPHSYGNAPDTTCIFIPFESIATVFDNTLQTQKPVCWWQDAREFQPLLERIVNFYAKANIKPAVGYLNAVLGELLEGLELVPRSKANQDTAVQILSYCAEHYTENITVKSIADALYISESYVSKIFSHKLLCSFRDYINALRIKKAKLLLRDTNKKILEIMLECGFQNQGSFNRVFRKTAGVSPLEYQAMRRKIDDGTYAKPNEIHF